jgi:hypothetical protein
MKCPFEECQRATTLPKESATHLIVAIDHKGRAHIHGPIEPEYKQLIERMILEVARYCQVDLFSLARKFDEVYGPPEPSRPAVLQ